MIHHFDEFAYGLVQSGTNIIFWFWKLIRKCVIFAWKWCQSKQVKVFSYIFFLVYIKFIFRLNIKQSHHCSHITCNLQCCESCLCGALHIHQIKKKRVTLYVYCDNIRLIYLYVSCQKFTNVSRQGKCVKYRTKYIGALDAQQLYETSTWKAQ